MKNWYIILFLGVSLSIFLIVQFLSESPETTFRRLVQKPIPKSVRLIKVGKFSTMDSSLFVLQFQISKSDLNAMLKMQRFFPLDEKKEFRRWDQNLKDYVQISKAEYLEFWSKQIQNSTKLNVNLASIRIIYTITENNGVKYVFVTPGGQEVQEVVFVAEAR